MCLSVKAHLPCQHLLLLRMSSDTELQGIQLSLTSWHAENQQCIRASAKSGSHGELECN